MAYEPGRPSAPKWFNSPNSAKDKQTLTITVTDEEDTGTPVPARIKNLLHLPEDRGQGQGVLFRRPTVKKLKVRITPSSEAQRACELAPSEDERLVTVPDTSEAGLFWQDTSRAALVKKEVKLSITNGMLTGVEVDNPSEVLAIVSLPADILKALLSIPASLLTFRVEQMTKAQGITDAELKALQSQIDLLQKQAALQKEQAAARASTQAQ